MRIVVIGLGIQGRKRLALAGPNVVATVDPVQAEANARQISELPISSFDAAYLCVPDPSKLQILRYLLEHGKHVLVEKPLLGTPAELQELSRLVAKNGATCYTAYNHRFEPHLTRMKQLIDDNHFGRIYFLRMFYGNGTAANIRASPWRDQGWGVIADLGSHLLDLGHFFFGPLAGPARACQVNRFENQAPDQAAFTLAGPPLVECEATFLSWRNTFTLDLFGEKGSGHVAGLCKWGPSTLTLRQRVWPSGAPLETVERIEQPDPTWKKEQEYFEKLCTQRGSNLQNDLWIAQTIRALTQSQG